jgi:hypothetical protein
MRGSQLQQITADELPALAKDAFVYGFPLVESMGTIYRMGMKAGVPMGAPVNTFGHARELVDAKTCRDLGIVSPNNDTLYSIAQVDVGPEPLVFHVPEMNGRYYVMQCVDAWSNNFAYVGTRATGTGEGDFLLTGPGWEGKGLAGMPVIHAPTRVFAIVGRFAVAGADDIPNVSALQDELSLTPLSHYPAKPDTSGRSVGDWPLPAPDKDVPEDLVFWETMRVWSQAFPPHPSETEYLRRFGQLGLLEKKTPYIDADPALRDALQAGEQEGRISLEKGARNAIPSRNRWSDTRDIFNYNVHFFEIGTINAPEWKIADPARRYLMRAIAAREGLWGNHAYEAYYPSTSMDIKGRQLSGDHRYVLHFERPPPVDAFWSITMYEVPQFYLVDNPIDRYAIGDRTPGLKFNADRSLDIYIQHEYPGPDRASNWLPAPAGAFRPILRMYMPGAEAFDERQWHLPPIRLME